MRPIAIEITRTHVWLAVGSASGTNVQLERLLQEPLQSPEDAPEALVRLVKTANVRGGKCVAIVRRSDVEMRVASLPTNDPNELPDMLRFSTGRLFAMAGETWPIDFVVLPKDALSIEPAAADAMPQTNVLAFAIAPTIVNNLRRSCIAAGLDLQSIQLAPLVLCDFVMKHAASGLTTSDAFLLVDSNESGSELTICKDGTARFMRCIRSTIEPTKPLTGFAGEIKRTIMAAAGGETPVSFDRVALVNVGPDQASELEPLIGKPVQAIAPSALIDLNKLASEDGENLPLSGWASIAAALSTPMLVKDRSPVAGGDIDFLNPRKAIPKKRSVGKLIAIGVAAGVLLLGGLYYYISSHRAIDQQIAMVEDQIADNQETLKLAVKMIADSSAIESFQKNSVNWLDQLAYLSANALPADQMVVGGLSADIQPLTGKAAIRANVAVTERLLGPAVEQQLRDSTHTFSTNGWNRSRDENATYKWVGAAEMTIKAGDSMPWPGEELTVPDASPAAAAAVPADPIPTPAVVAPEKTQ